MKNINLCVQMESLFVKYLKTRMFSVQEAEMKEHVFMYHNMI